MFGVWRTCQHYATPGSLPDATSVSREKVVAASTRIKPYNDQRQFIGELRDDVWYVSGWAEKGTFSPAKPGPRDTYERVRLRGGTFSNDSYSELTDTDHPLRTVDLDAEVGSWSGEAFYPVNAAPVSGEAHGHSPDGSRPALDETLDIMRALIGVQLPVVLGRRHTILEIKKETGSSQMRV